jgi:hypothetical protein
MKLFDKQMPGIRVQEKSRCRRAVFHSAIGQDGVLLRMQDMKAADKITAANAGWRPQSVAALKFDTALYEVSTEKTK